jgi:hypothetical protein
MNEKTTNSKFNSLQEVISELKSYPIWKVIISVIIPLIGIFLLWKNKMFNIGTRIVLTVILLFILSYGYNNSGIIPGSSINGTYTFEKDGYQSKFRISGNSYSGSWVYCMNGDCEDESKVSGSVEDNTLYQESEYTEANGTKGVEMGYIDSEGKLHYNTNIGSLVLEK